MRETYIAPTPHDLEPLRRATEKRDRARTAARQAVSALVAAWDRIDAGEDLDAEDARLLVGRRNDAKAKAEREWVVTWKAAGSPWQQAREGQRRTS